MMCNKRETDDLSFWKWLFFDEDGLKEKLLDIYWFIHIAIGIAGACILSDKTLGWFSQNNILIPLVAIIIAICLPISSHYISLILSGDLDYLDDTPKQGIKYHAFSFQYGMLVIIFNILTITFIIYLTPQIDMIWSSNPYHYHCLETFLKFLCFTLFSWLIRSFWEMLGIIPILAIHAVRWRKTRPDKNN